MVSLSTRSMNCWDLAPGEELSQQVLNRPSQFLRCPDPSLEVEESAYDDEELKPFFQDSLECIHNPAAYDNDLNFSPPSYLPQMKAYFVDSDRMSAYDLAPGEPNSQSVDHNSLSSPALSCPPSSLEIADCAYEDYVPPRSLVMDIMSKETAEGSAVNTMFARLIYKDKVVTSSAEVEEAQNPHRSSEVPPPLLGPRDEDTQESISNQNRVIREDGRSDYVRDLGAYMAASEPSTKQTSQEHDSILTVSHCEEEAIHMRIDCRHETLPSVELNPPPSFPECQEDPILIEFAPKNQVSASPNVDFKFPPSAQFGEKGVLRCSETIQNDNEANIPNSSFRSDALIAEEVIPLRERKLPSLKSSGKRPTENPSQNSNKENVTSVNESKSTNSSQATRPLVRLVVAPRSAAPSLANSRERWLCPRAGKRVIAALRQSVLDSWLRG